MASLGTNPIAFSAPRTGGLAITPPCIVYCCIELLVLTVHLQFLRQFLAADPVVVDMATTTVPFGRVEVYSRKGDKLPSDTWAVDGDGRSGFTVVFSPDNRLWCPTRVNHVVSCTARPCLDASRVIFEGGSVLPLGGASEVTGGHKGYLCFLALLICDCHKSHFTDGAGVDTA